MPNRRPFPIPRLTASKNALTFHQRVSSYLCSKAGSELYARTLVHTPFPSPEMLAEHIARIAFANGRDYIRDSPDITNPGKHAITAAQILKLADKAALDSLRVFDPEYVKRRATIGGENSRRGPEKRLLKLWPSVKDLSIAEAAKAMQCSESTVSRMRARDRAAALEIPVITGDPEMDALLHYSTALSPSPAAQSQPEPTTDVLADIDIEAMFTTLTSYAWGVRA